MGVGDGEILQDALDGAILAERPVQGVEGDIRRERRQHLADVATDVDAGDPIAFLLQRIGARIPRRKRDRSLGREAPHQHGHVLVPHSLTTPSAQGSVPRFPDVESGSSGGLTPRPNAP